MNMAVTEIPKTEARKPMVTLPKSLVLMDFLNTHDRLDFNAIRDTVNKTTSVLCGYHVLPYNTTSNVEPVSYNLPDNFVPIYGEVNPEFKEDSRNAYVRVHARLANAASMKIITQILEDTSHDIQELHAIVNTDIYIPLFEATRIAGVKVTLYTPRKSLLQYCDSIVPWTEFADSHMFS